jgi:hypothetical protein
MRSRMVECNDPLLPAFDNRDNADAARAVFDDSYANRKLTGANNYNNWTNQYELSSADAEFSSDPDEDGIDNLTEYSFGGIPTNGSDSAVMPIFRTSTDGSPSFEYVYRRRRDAADRGLHYDLSLRTNLLAGFWVADGYTETGTAVIDADFEWVTNSIPTANTTNQFIRMKCIAW